MEISIPPDLGKHLEFLVTEEHSATHIGSGSVRVLSTPSMILFMEKAAGAALEDVLDDQLSSVGTEVNIQHRMAVKIGETVLSEASVNSIDGKKVVFDVKVTLNDEIVGVGSHTRYVINKEKFLSRL